MEDKNKKKIFMIGMSVLLILILVIGGTYAWFTLQLNGTKVNVLKAGTLSLILNDENSVGINSEKAVPMLDEVGETMNPYHFTLENQSDIASEYTIYLDDINLEETETRMDDAKVKYQLVKDETKTTALLNTIGTHPNRVLDTGTIDGNTTITYDLRLWIDENAGNEVMGQTVKTKIRVVATQSTKIQDNNTTSKECFTFDSSTGKISGFTCNQGNSQGLPIVTDLVIPETIDGNAVTTIGYYAFAGKNLTSVTIPDSVTTIDAGAFSHNQLTEVTIPEGVTIIMGSTFLDNQLTNVVLPNGVTQILSSAFENNKLSSLTIPDTVTVIGSNAFNNNQLSDEDAFIYQRNGDGSINNTLLIGYGGAKRENVIIPNNVTIIKDYAFYGNQLTSITIPNSVTEIWDSAFTNNNLTNIIIPSSVIDISNNAIEKSTDSNANLVKIVNQTGKSFDWQSITGGSTTATFVTGTIAHAAGNIIVSAS